VALGDRPAAEAILAWVATTAADDGELPEQVDHHLLAPERRQEWIDRWGSVASPLLWSHGMFLRLRAELDGAGAAA
jgi:GH15 family glucan-1,4-alpha-glucosidase